MMQGGALGGRRPQARKEMEVETEVARPLEVDSNGSGLVAPHVDSVKAYLLRLYARARIDARIVQSAEVSSLVVANPVQQDLGYESGYETGYESEYGTGYETA